MKLLHLPPSLYRHAVMLSGLVTAACGAVLMAVAANPSLAAIVPSARGVDVVYTELALIASVIAGSALLHARGYGRTAATALWTATGLWWLSSALFVGLSPVFGLIGLVALLACVASAAADGGAASQSPALEGRGFFPVVSLYGRAASR